MAPVQSIFICLIATLTTQVHSQFRGPPPPPYQSRKASHRKLRFSTSSVDQQSIAWNSANEVAGLPPVRLPPNSDSFSVVREVIASVFKTADDEFRAANRKKKRYNDRLAAEVFDVLRRTYPDVYSSVWVWDTISTNGSQPYDLYMGDPDFAENCQGEYIPLACMEMGGALQPLRPVEIYGTQKQYMVIYTKVFTFLPELANVPFDRAKWCTQGQIGANNYLDAPGRYAQVVRGCINRLMPQNWPVTRALFIIPESAAAHGTESGFLMITKSQTNKKRMEIRLPDLHGSSFKVAIIKPYEMPVLQIVVLPGIARH